MTREEQLKQAAIDRYGNNGNESQYMLGKIQAFMVGARYADKTMLDKVCEHLYAINRNNLAEYGRRCPMINVVEFRKAMEEIQ